MLTYAIIVFAVAALGGLLLASFVLRGKLAPWAVSLLHAALGAIGLLLVIYAALSTGIAGAALAALIILIIAALAGFYLASIHLRSQVAPKGTVFLHVLIKAAAAIAAQRLAQRSFSVFTVRISEI